jgi:hypothetical protein
MIERSFIKNYNRTTLITVLYFSIVYSHIIIPVYYITFKAIQYYLFKDYKEKYVLFFSIILFSSMLIFYANYYIPNLIYDVITYARDVFVAYYRATISGSVTQRPFVDVIAQNLSRIIVVTTGLISGVGFLFIILKKKMLTYDKIILISSSFYVFIGLFVDILANRAINLIALPVCIGITYYQSNYRKVISAIFLILILLFPFIPLHESFREDQIHFQTKENYYSSNFLIQNYNWKEPSNLLAHFRHIRYLQTKTASSVWFDDDTVNRANFDRGINSTDFVFYSPGLGKSMLTHDYDIEVLYRDYNIVYNSATSMFFTNLYSREYH